MVESARDASERAWLHSESYNRVSGDERDEREGLTAASRYWRRTLKIFRTCSNIDTGVCSLVSTSPVNQTTVLTSLDPLFFTAGAMSRALLTNLLR